MPESREVSRYGQPVRITTCRNLVLLRRFWLQPSTTRPHRLFKRQELLAADFADSRGFADAIAGRLAHAWVRRWRHAARAWQALPARGSLAGPAAQARLTAGPDSAPYASGSGRYRQSLCQHTHLDWDIDRQPIDATAFSPNKDQANLSNIWTLRSSGKPAEHGCEAGLAIKLA